MTWPQGSTMVYGYDSAGRIAAKSEATGGARSKPQTTTYTYDGNLVVRPGAGPLHDPGPGARFRRDAAPLILVGIGALIGGGSYYLTHRKNFNWGEFAVWTGAGALAP